jgi:hypothetical protein
MSCFANNNIHIVVDDFLLICVIADVSFGELLIVLEHLEASP